MKYLSLGAGVNSTALLVLKAQGKIDFDLAIFADTGGEQPETYRYLEEVIKPFCIKHKIQLDIVRKDGKNLYDDNFERKIIPTRMFRSCTDKFKQRAIRKYLKQFFPDKELIPIIGFCKGEEKRLIKAVAVAEFPLIDLGIDRDGCVKIIRDFGLPIPIKSGCYFCPFQGEKQLLKLLKEHPDLYSKAEALEKNGSRYPEMVLSFAMSLEELRRAYEAWQKTKPTQRETAQATLWYSMPKTEYCPMCEIEDNSEMCFNMSDVERKQL